MDATALAKLIEAQRRFPALIEAVVAGIDEAVLRGREEPGRWSPIEILRHVLDEEIFDFRPRARYLVEGGDAPAAIDPPTWVIERDYQSADKDETLAQFAAERAASCAWLATLSPDDLQRERQITEKTKLRAGDVIAAWHIHDWLHLRQLSTAIVALTARSLTPWKVGYAGTIPFFDDPLRS